MTTDPLDEELLQQWQLLSEEDKKTVLSRAKSIINKRDRPKRMTREDWNVLYNKELDMAIAEAREGLVTTQEDLEKEAESW